MRNKEKLILEHSKLVESGWFVKGIDYHSIIYHAFGHLIGNKYKIDCLEIAGQILQIEDKKMILKYRQKIYLNMQVISQTDVKLFQKLSLLI